MAAHEILGPGDTRSGIAGGAITQFTFVAAATGASAPVYSTASTAASATPCKYFGVAQTDATTGAVVQMAVTGVTKVIAAEAIVAGQYVTIAAGGKAAVAASGYQAAGLAKSSAPSANQIVAVDLLHGVTA